MGWKLHCIRLTAEETMKKKISELEDKAIESIQNETHKDIFFLKKNRTLSCGTKLNGLLLCYWSPRKKKDGRRHKIIKEIVAENFSKWD